MNREELAAFSMKVNAVDTEYGLSEDVTMNTNESAVDLISFDADERNTEDNLNCMNISCKTLAVSEQQGLQSPYITMMVRNLGAQLDSISGESRSLCLTGSTTDQVGYTGVPNIRNDGIHAQEAQCFTHATVRARNLDTGVETENDKYKSQVLLDSFSEQAGSAVVPDIRNDDIDAGSVACSIHNHATRSFHQQLGSASREQHAKVQDTRSDCIQTENVEYAAQNYMGGTARDREAELENINGAPNPVSLEVDSLKKQVRHAAVSDMRMDVENAEYSNYGFGIMTEESVSNEGHISSDVDFDEYDKYPLKDEDLYNLNWEKGSDMHEPCVATVFSSGDLVWAKVKSHPWWPGQVFNANDASPAAQKIQKSGRLLVAFFGDGTFGWLQESQLIPFKPYFEEKVKQTTTKAFCRAVAEALDEICRRSELGLSCSHYSGALYSKNTFPDTNAGIQDGVRIRCHRDISVSREEFAPKKMLEFVKDAACSPLYPMNFTVEFSECCGHVYGARKFFFNSGVPNMLSFKEPNEDGEKAVQHDLKRKFSSVESAENKHDKEAKRPHLCKPEVVNEEKNEIRGSEDGVRKNDVSKCREQSPRSEKEEIILFPEDSNVFIEHRSVVSEDPFSIGKRLLSLQEIQDYEPKRRPEKLAVRRRPINKGKELENNHDFVQISAGSHRDDDISVYATVLSEELQSVDADNILLKEENKTEHAAGFGNTHAKLPSRERSLENAQKTNNSTSSETLFFEFKDADSIKRFVKDEMELDNQSAIPTIVRGPQCKEEGKVLKVKKKTELTDSSEGHQTKKMKKDKIVGQEGVVQKLKETNGKELAKQLSPSKKVQHVEGKLLKTTDNSGREKRFFEHGNEIPISSRLIAKKTRHSLYPVLQGLHILAVDPSRYATSRFQEVASAFLRYRNVVFLKSSGYGSTDIGMSSKPKAVKKVSTVIQDTKSGKPMLNSKDSFQELNEVKTQHRPLNTTDKSEKSDLQNTSMLANQEQKFLTKKTQSQKHGSQKSNVDIADRGKTTISNLSSQSLRPGLQELATAARRKKLEVEQAIAAAKKVEHPQGASLNKMSVSDLKHDSKSMKHYRLSKDASSSLYRKSPVHKATDAKTTETSHGLFIQFPPGFAMPSEAEFNEVFSRFGTLETAGIRLYSKNSSATVVYKNSQDAETALKHSVENKLFGTGVSFKLRIFAQSQKTPTHRDASILKYASIGKDDQGKSPVIENAAQNHPRSTSSVMENAAQNHTKNTSMSTCMPVASPRSNEQVHVRSSNITTIETNSLNLTSVSTVNVPPSCDIKDQMMKLLHEVSFIVSSIYLNPEATWHG